jgi:ankyrin repeat protein
MAENNDDDDDAANPIIEAMENRESLEVIRAIIDAHPAMLRQRNRAGYLPIHWAIDEVLPPEVVRTLLDRWPDSVLERTAYRARYLPAHLACLRASEIVVAVGREEEDDEYDDGSSHINGENGGDAPNSATVSALETLQIIFDAGPETFRAWRDAFDRLPLHVLFLFGFPPLEVVRFVVERHPQALRAKDRLGDLPLHEAVQAGNATVAGIRYLIDRCPGSVRAVANFGETPLVRAVESHAPLPVVGLLVSEWPESVRRTDRFGATALHEAARAKNVAAARYLLACHPPLVHARSDSGQTPLHEAASAGSVEMCQVLVRPWPLAVRVPNNAGRLPIHEAASRGEGGAVRLLAGLWPESVLQKSVEGWLPVHHAVRFRPGTEPALHRAWDAVQFLVAQYPESVGDLTDAGHLPLHIAAGGGCFDWDDRVDGSDVRNQMARLAELAYVRFLVGRASPMSVRVLSNDGKLPIHCAVEDGFSLDAIRFLYRTWPDSIELRAAKGASALHLAVSRQDPMVAHVQFLVEQRPELLNEVDEYGRLPVHYAVNSEGPMEILLFLVEQNPKSLGRMDLEGSLPLHGCAGDHPSYNSPTAPQLERARYLVERHPPSLARPDASGNLPLHVSVARGMVSLELVHMLVEARPESVRQKNASGRLPLHLAALNREAPLDVLYYLLSYDPESLALPSNASSGERCPRQRKRPKWDV